MQSIDKETEQLVSPSEERQPFQEILGLFLPMEAFDSCVLSVADTVDNFWIVDPPPEEAGRSTGCPTFGAGPVTRRCFRILTQELFESPQVKHGWFRRAFLPN